VTKNLIYFVYLLVMVILLIVRHICKRFIGLILEVWSANRLLEEAGRSSRFNFGRVNTIDCFYPAAMTIPGLPVGKRSRYVQIRSGSFRTRHPDNTRTWSSSKSVSTAAWTDRTRARKEAGGNQNRHRGVCKYASGCRVHVLISAIRLLSSADIQNTGRFVCAAFPGGDADKEDSDQQ
jgi:hypothetical protein